MRLRKVVRMFEHGNVSVCGLRGTGKDMLTANVVVRRKLPYMSNVNYGGNYIPLDMKALQCGGNIYHNFIEGKVNYFVWPYPDGTDVYLSDSGVYFPSQFHGQLDRDYGCIATFMALSRHIGANNVHTNAQNLNRVYDKIREQSDQYICANRCIVIFGFVFQIVTIYDRYQSAVDRVPPFRLSRSLFSADRKYDYDKERLRYEISYGRISRRFLFYRNKSNYNTRIFREILANGT